MRTANEYICRCPPPEGRAQAQGQRITPVMSSRASIISIWVCFILLLTLGVVMVASTGTCVPGQDELPWTSTFLGKQCMFALLGLVIALVLSKVD